MKRSILIAVAAIAVTVALFVLAVLPSRKRVEVIRGEIAGLNDTINKMHAEIAGTEQQKIKAAAAAATLEKLTAGGVIEPLLGSFAMRGKSLLTPLAQETGFVIDSVRELAPIPLQTPKPAPEQLYARQPIEFTGHGSYDQITAFITQVESTYSLTMLSSLLILSQPQTPETHKALITFEWPTKGEKHVPPAKTGN